MHTEQKPMTMPKARSIGVSADQGGLFTSVRWPRAKTPKRAEALANLERLLPWADLEQSARMAYRSDLNTTGRPGYPLSMMLKCFVLCLFWRLSDDQAEAVILDSHATARFVGTDPWKPRPPSASAIREFRKRLELHGVLNEILGRIEGAIDAAGLTVRDGTVREPVFKRKAGKAESK